MTLAKQILAKQRSLGIGNNAQLAKRIGISLPTLYSVLSGRRTPNARTVDAYAEFLQLPPDRVRVLGRPRSASRPMSAQRRVRR